MARPLRLGRRKLSDPAGNVTGMSGDADGLIWWSTPAATVGLVVADAVVVDCPPYARRWALGQDARDLWRQGRRQRADLVWLSGGLHVERKHLGNVYGRRTVSAWKYHASHVSGDTFLYLGWHPDGRWWVDPTWRRGGGWLFAGLGAEDAARARAAELLAEPQRLSGEWAATVAERDPDALWEVRAADVPPRPPSSGVE